jgi:hypothetical protein
VSCRLLPERKASVRFQSETFKRWINWSWPCRASGATVLRKGDFDVRLEAANTASIARDSEAQAEVAMKFETIRAGLFLRYGLTDRLELGAEIPGYHRYRGFMEGAIIGVERGTTGVAPPRKALRETGYAFNISNGSRTLFQGNEGATGLGRHLVLRQIPDSQRKLEPSGPVGSGRGQGSDRRHRRSVRQRAS